MKISRVQKILAMAGSMTLSHCGAYMSLMNKMPIVESVRAVNAMSIPVCMVRTSLDSDPSLTDESGQRTSTASPFLQPGAEGFVTFPVPKAPEGGPGGKPEDRYTVQIYGCERIGSAYRASDVIATLNDIDPRTTKKLALR